MVMNALPIIKGAARTTACGPVHTNAVVRGRPEKDLSRVFDIVDGRFQTDVSEQWLERSAP